MLWGKNDLQFLVKECVVIFQVIFSQHEIKDHEYFIRLNKKVASGVRSFCSEKQSKVLVQSMKIFEKIGI